MTLSAQHAQRVPRGKDTVALGLLFQHSFLKSFVLKYGPFPEVKCHFSKAQQHQQHSDFRLHLDVCIFLDKTKMVSAARDLTESSVSSTKGCRAAREGSRADMKLHCLQRPPGVPSRPCQPHPSPSLARRSKWDKQTSWKLLLRNSPCAPDMFLCPWSIFLQPGQAWQHPGQALSPAPPALASTALPLLTVADLPHLLLAYVPQVLHTKP